MAVHAKRRRDEASSAEILQSVPGDVRPLCLDVTDTNDFNIEIKLLADAQAENGPACFLMGIVPAVMSDRQLSFNSRDEHCPPNGVFIDDIGNFWMQECAFKEGDVLPIGLNQVVRMEFRGTPYPTLRFLFKGSGSTCVFRNLPMKEHVPCVIFQKAGYEVEARVLDSNKHRIVDTRDVLAKMWDTRAFTDAEIVCEGHRFPVHREVLSAVSPVFAAAFGGQMKEAVSAQLEVQDASAKSVEALLRHAYTKSLEPSIALAVLPLAHRYQMKKLLEQCGTEIISDLRPETVASTVKALRVLREEDVIAPIWCRIVRALQVDVELLRATLESPT